MPSIETFMTFLLALTLLEISPGPDMMLTIARGVGQGRGIALLTVLGNVFVAGGADNGCSCLAGCAGPAKVGWCGLSPKR